MMKKGNKGGLKQRESLVISEVIASCCACVVGNGLEALVRDTQTVTAE